MNSLSNLAPTLFRATFLATILFWTLIFSERFDNEIFVFVILSIVPISIVCSLTIIITIMPFFWLKNKNVSNNEIFKMYFPYYSIIAFGFSSYFIISTNFENFVCIFFITAFFTLMQSWVWICKTPFIQQQKGK